MELVIIAVALAAAAMVFYYNRKAKSLDLNQDGEVDLTDIKMGVETAKQGIAADIVKVKTAARATVKKAAAKKPAAKKPAAKKPAVKKK
jgi:hypothetical protein